MTVIVEFTINNEEFSFGQVFSGASDGMHLELERIVPIGRMVMPYLWVTGENHAAFEEQVRSHPLVKELRVLDKVADNGLYRIDWAHEPTSLIDGIADTDAVVLEAEANETWVFRLRFDDHDLLSQFHNYVIAQSIPIQIKQINTLADEMDGGYRFGLTAEQREALVLALRRGYFETPSEISLGELGEELGISKQSLSARIRRGNLKILRKTLLSSVE